MNVTYLGHSGFLVETDRAYYLFDYIMVDTTIRELPLFDDSKALYVFASHSHEDHFSMKIFDDNIINHATAYIFGYDIKRKFRKDVPAVIDGIMDKIYWGRSDVIFEFEECRVLNLRSTDMGVAFVVTETNSVNDFNIYHAGDLNWWYKYDKDKAWNRNMEVNYKREIDKIKDIPFDAAFVPLDPRLGDAYYYGFKYFLDTVPAKKVFPMHCWGEYSIIDKYISEYGDADRVVRIGKDKLLANAGPSSS